MSANLTNTAPAWPIMRRGVAGADQGNYPILSDVEIGTLYGCAYVGLVEEVATLDSRSSDVSRIALWHLGRDDHRVDG